MMYSNLLKLTLLLSTLSITSGCATFSLFEEEPPKEVVKIQTVQVPIPITHPDLPRAVQLKRPEFKVVSAKNVEQFLKDMEVQNGGSLVFVAMTIDDYEVLAYNVQELKRYINQLKEVVVYYRNIDPNKETKDESKNADAGKP